MSCSYVQTKWPVEVRALLDGLLIGLIDLNAGTLPIINRGGASMPSTSTTIVYFGAAMRKITTLERLGGYHIHVNFP